MRLIHVKTMALVDESRTTNIIASARINITEQIVNVSKTHNQTEITSNQESKHFYSIERKFYILRASLNFFKRLEVIEDFVNS